MESTSYALARSTAVVSSEMVASALRSPSGEKSRIRPLLGKGNLSLTEGPGFVGHPLRLRFGEVMERRR
ncbi:hypothetical protein Y032_0403g825 [Ancylostoma ceylanicum]|uniref:Uncharacterized protein n=1 Tax=Ancylostoma ceylanicum TaxID=53326 RepID=A0A016X2V8_9BILA|nr:hypothetical protein Y032_0403g825 [Ancylostoma ceylanicum]